VERFLREEIRSRFPEHGFIGEETGGDVEGKELVWAVDPIDGTAPFVYELPVWAVSVGLVSREGCMVGFVYLPVLDDLFWNIAGEPAYLNEREIRVHDPVNFGRESTIMMPSSRMPECDCRY